MVWFRVFMDDAKVNIKSWLIKFVNDIQNGKSWTDTHRHVDYTGTFK